VYQVSINKGIILQCTAYQISRCTCMSLWRGQAQFCVLFLGAFSDMRRATVRFVMSVRPSTWNNSAPTGRTFRTLDIWLFFENLWRKCKFHWNVIGIIIIIIIIIIITVLYMQTDRHTFSTNRRSFLL